MRARSGSGLRKRLDDRKEGRRTGLGRLKGVFSGIKKSRPGEGQDSSKKKRSNAGLDTWARVRSYKDLNRGLVLNAVRIIFGFQSFQAVTKILRVKPFPAVADKIPSLPVLLPYRGIEFPAAFEQILQIRH